MFVVERDARGHRYLYLVESVREGKQLRQRTVQALGRKDHLVANSALDRLLASIGRHSERSVLLSEMAAGTVACTRIGLPVAVWTPVGAVGH